MANEADMGFQWIVATLTGDATLMGLVSNVWRSMAPVSATYPFVVLAMQAGTDVITMNAYRVFDNFLYNVRVVGPQSSTATLVSAANRIDTLLTSTIVTVSNGFILSSHRETPIYIDELVNGELLLNVGGLYRMEVQAVN